MVLTKSSEFGINRSQPKSFFKKTIFYASEPRLIPDRCGDHPNHGYNSGRGPIVAARPCIGRIESFAKQVAGGPCDQWTLKM